MDMKHTPGPVTEDHINILLAGVAQAVINIAEGHTTIEEGSRLDGAFRGLCEPRVANLIAAAPELLAALRHVLAVVEMFADGRKPMDCVASMHKARAAIARAEGKV